MVLCHQLAAIPPVLPQQNDKQGASQASIYNLTVTKTYLGDFRQRSVCNTHGGGGKVVLLQYKGCPKTKYASRPRKDLQRAAAGASEEGVGHGAE